MTDIRTGAPIGGQNVDRAQQADDLFNWDVGPQRVPDSIKKKMKILEAGKSAQAWRIAKNVGAAVVGVGVAMALLSNPVGWAVAGTAFALGGAALLAGTIGKARFDFARLDVHAFAQSLDQDEVREQAHWLKKAGALGSNVLESAAYGVAGYFAATGIGAAFSKSAFQAMVGAQQGLGAELITQTVLPALYGVGGLAGVAVGAWATIPDKKDLGRIRYQINITEGLPEYQGDLEDHMPKSAAIYSFHKKAKEIAAQKSNRSERTQVTVTGPVQRHADQTSDVNVNWHRDTGAQLSQRPLQEQMTVDDQQLLQALSEQNDDYVSKKVRGSGYALKTIPDQPRLFANGPPKLADISQSHRRCNCYLLAALTSALVRDGGSRKIEQIMQDNQDGTVTVRLAKADVTVSKTRLVTDNGYNAFSAGADWVNLLEKALAGYLLMRPAGGNTFDQGKLGSAMGLLDHLMGPPNQNAGDLDVPRNIETTSSSEKPEEWHRIIDHSLDNDCPLVFTTKDEDYPGKMMKRIMPDHSYPIIGKAQRNGQNGYLVADPYGSLIGTAQPSQRSPAGLVYDEAQRGASSVFFVAADKARDLFDRLWFDTAGKPPDQPENRLMA